MTVISNIHEFWERFMDEEPDLLNALKNENYETLLEILAGLDKECYAISGAHFFVEATADAPEMTLDSGPSKTSQYICQEMRRLAPTEIKRKWIINDTLGPLSQKAIEAQAQIKDDIYTLFDFTVFYEVDMQQQSFLIHLYCPGFALIDNPEHKREMCIYLTELAIGQTALEAYVSFIDFTNTPMEDMKICNLTDLYNVIMDTAEANHWKEYKSPLEIYSVYQPHQDIASDSLRKDMKMIFSTHPLLVEESLGTTHDVSLDLQSKGGEYGYIYYANPFSGKEDSLFRQELAKTLDQAFAPLHCARVIGGAIGKSYSYIDLILFDKKQFLAAFKQIQQQLKDKVELYYRSFKDDKA